MSRPLSLLAAIAMSTLAACATKESKPADSAAADTGAAATTAGPNEVTITATDYAFDAPESIPAGWTHFKLVDSGKQVHHATLFKLTEGKTFTDAVDVLKTLKPNTQPPTWIVPAGGPNAIGPGGTGDAIINMQPGNYMWMCFIPDSVGAPHFTHGMMKGLTVTTGSPGTNQPPTPDITVTLSDFKFDWSTPLTAGNHTIEVKTAAGGQPHEIEVFKLAQGKTAADLQAWLGKMIQGKLTPADGPPPAELLGGIAAMVPNGSQYFTANFTPGDYVMMCFVEDAKQHKPHFMLGMIQTIKVS